MASLESQGVLYSASFDIPYAIGSVAIPLAEAASLPFRRPAAGGGSDDARGADGPHAGAPKRRGVTSGNISSVRRCTHHRYCYIRDGGDLQEDAMYRWLQHQQGEMTETTGTYSEDGAEAKRHRKEEQKGEGSGASASGAHREGGGMHSPSLFYASIASVVFLLPSSFPHPRRVLHRPPFLIEDDTWAEHMIEVQLHFLPHLRIPPMTVVHQALLERRTLPVPRLVPSTTTTAAAAAAAAENNGGSVVTSSSEVEEVREVWVPQLLASTFGKPKLPPVATKVVAHHSHHQPPPLSPPEVHTTAAAATAEGETSNPPQTPSHHSSASKASTTVVVAEKVDTLRLYHPSLPVLQHARRVLAMAALPVLEEMRDAFAELYAPASAPHVMGETHGDTARLSMPFRFPWSLPYEEVVAEYAAQRAPTSVAVLQAVLAGLKRERATMEATCRRSLNQVAELATTVLPEQLADVHQRCLRLYRKE